MAAKGPSQAELKRRLDSRSQQIFEIDLKIQSFRTQGKVDTVRDLEAAKLELQKQIVSLQIDLELVKAKAKKK